MTISCYDQALDNVWGVGMLGPKPRQIVWSIVRDQAREIRFEAIAALCPAVRQLICDAVDILLAFSRENPGSR